MKILKEEKIPPKWWIGQVYNCANCCSLLEIEKESDASPAGTNLGGDITLIEFKCPVCGEVNIAGFPIDK
mgnify:CR=1 FL=1|jgi:hypothetical protein